MVKILVGIVLSLTIALLAGQPLVAQAADSASATLGHCNYRQRAPALRTWYRVCAMPATAQSCKEEASWQKEQMDYGDGACAVKGVVGLCVVGNQQIVFYQGSESTLAKGCEMMHGSWRPDLIARE